MSEVLSAERLTGAAVRNTAGDDVGKIEDFMLDLESGRIRYAVLSFGGVLGVGSKLFAVPPDAMTCDAASGDVAVDVPRDKLKGAPGFDKDRWPNFADPLLGSELYGYYGRKPYWE